MADCDLGNCYCWGKERQVSAVFVECHGASARDGSQLWSWTYR